MKMAPSSLYRRTINNIMSQQRDILDHTIEKWRGDLDQLDDILVIGRRF